MGIWPFGREPSDVELVSRVVTATCKNQSQVRGKLTVHFAEPQTQASADEAGDRCASATEDLLREATAPIEVLGHEPEIAARLLARMPAGLPPTRSVELAALHVVGVPLTSQPRRPSSMTMAAVRPPGSIPPPPAVSPSTMPPAMMGAGPIRRPSSTRMRAITSDLLIAPGAPPDEIARGVAPLVRDSAARLLVAILRAYDLLVVRGIRLDDESTELEALVPVSDAAPGAYEASRAAEIARWESTLGAAGLDALRREAALVSVVLLFIAMRDADVQQAAATAVLDALAASAFGGQGPITAEVGRYLHPVHGSIAAEVGARVARALGKEARAEALDPALAPVLSALQVDLGIAAALVRNATRAG